MTMSCGAVSRDLRADGLDGGLQLAAVEEDAVALAAVVDVDGAQQHLGEAAGAGGAVGDLFSVGTGGGPAAPRQQAAQARQLLSRATSPRA